MASVHDYVPTTTPAGISRTGAGQRHFLSPSARIYRHIRRMERLAAKGDPRLQDPEFAAQQFDVVIGRIANPYKR